MPKGRAKCKECGRLVIAEVEKDIKCPGCSRIFQIPGEPQYTNSNPLRNHSLARLSSGLGLGLDLMGSLGTKYQWHSADISDKWEVPQRMRHESFQIKLLSFPGRNAPVLLQEKDRLRVVVEFYGHELSDIEMSIKDNNLILKSKLPPCSYQNTVALPRGFDKISQAILKNDILEVSLNLAL